MQSITPDKLEGWVRELLIKQSVPDTTAEAVAESLVLADLCGHGSHGVSRIPFYKQMIDENAIDPSAKPSISGENTPLIQVDGHSTFGHAVGRKTITVATDSVSAHGVAIVGIRNATHLGRIGEWAERAAAEGNLFLAFLNSGGGAPLVAPPGSAERMLSTNPIAMGVPTFDVHDFPIVLDMATSQVATGKIREERWAGQSLPEDWTITESGDSVDDPAAFLDDGKGALLPLGGRTGGHKGYGLAVMSELFAGLIGGGRVQGESKPDWFSNAATFVLIDPLEFSTRETIETKIQQLSEYLYGAKTIGDNRIYLPGELEYLQSKERLNDGIPLEDKLIAELVELSNEFEIRDAVPSSIQNL